MYSFRSKPARRSPMLPLLLSTLAAGCHSRSVSTPATPAASPAIATTSTVAPPLPAGYKTYTDPSTGVSFGYPPDWKPQQPDSGLASPTFQPLAGSARVKLTLYPQGSAFEHTNLVGLTFAYTAKPNSSALDCEDLAANSPSGSGDIASRTINGIAFNEGNGSDAGMCHSVAETVDTALHNGQCLVFERDFETECSDISGKGTHELTPEQRSALQHQLDAVMGSVTIGR